LGITEVDMNWEVVIAAFLGFLGASIPGFLALLQNRRKSRAEEKLIAAQVQIAEATEDSVRTKTLKDVIDSLRQRISDLENNIKELQERNLNAEKRATTSDARSATSDARALVYEQMFTRARSDVAALGERIDKERKANECRVNKLALLVARLIKQIEESGGKPEVSLEELDQMVKIGG